SITGERDHDAVGLEVPLGQAGQPLVVLDVHHGDVLGDGHPPSPYPRPLGRGMPETCLHTCRRWYRRGPVPVVLLALLAASSPAGVCLDGGVCTPISRLGKQGDTELVRHTERLPTHVEAGAPFAAWMTWPRPPESVRKQVLQKQPVEVRTVIPAARLR